jgi:hypothetical protein
MARFIQMSDPNSLQSIRRMFSKEELDIFAALPGQLIDDQHVAERTRTVSNLVISHLTHSRVGTLHGEGSYMQWAAYRPDLGLADGVEETEVLLLAHSETTDLSVDDPSPAFFRIIRSELYSPGDTRQFLTTDVAMSGLNKTRYYVGALSTAGSFGPTFRADTLDKAYDPTSNSFCASYFLISDKGRLHFHVSFPKVRFPLYSIEDDAVGTRALPFGDWQPASQLDALSVASEILNSIRDTSPYAVSCNGTSS